MIIGTAIVAVGVLVAFLLPAVYLYGFDSGFKAALRECATNHEREMEDMK